jgi:glyoxalase family protein
MQLDGIHHITAITGDAPGNVEFYVGTLGLRMVKKSVNQDDPTVYHLFYGDDEGHPGADLTFFEYPGVARGRAGDGMVHTIAWRVASDEALDFWQQRLADAGARPERGEGTLRFADPEGLVHELQVYAGDEEPLTAQAPDIPAEHALLGFAGVRAYTSDATRSQGLLSEGMGFERTGDTPQGGTGSEWRVAGPSRSSFYVYDTPPAEPGQSGGGTVHHVAFATEPEEHEAWRPRVAEAGARPTPVIDRFYFKSIYFREPSGVLFELATKGPGFAVDEPAESLGERLSLPPDYEQYREELEQKLTPLPDPRSRAATS